MTIVTSLASAWVDERLTWDPSSYGGVQSMTFFQDEVWKPQMTLGTPVEFTIMTNKEMHVHVNSNGHASMNVGNVLNSACQFNMRFWPFDKQVCNVDFFALDLFVHQATVRLTEPSLVLFTDRNLEWVIEKTSSSTNEEDWWFPMAQFRLYLRRQSTFYIMSLILPIFGMNLITSLVFLLPTQSGERVSYSITIMLALAVFFTVVADEIPRVSDPASLICIFLLAGIIISLICMFIVIVNMGIYYRSDTMQIGDFYKIMVKYTQKGLYCKTNKVHAKDDNQDKSTHVQGMPFNDNLKLEEAGIDMNDRADVSEEEYLDERMTWIDVSHAIDKISFIVITMFTSLGSFFLLLYMGLASDYNTDPL